MARKLTRAHLLPRSATRSWVAGLWLILLTLPAWTGCSHRPRAWGFPGAQGTIDRQKSRATIHDPYPLNDIGPEVVGGRPREFYSPQSEAAREANVPLQYRNLPPSY
jgi:hypothetical protein